MSAQTLTRHHHAELRFAGADDTTGIVHFQAESKGTKGKVNTVSLDTATGAIHCDCTAGIVGTSSCWHADWVGAAWAAHPSRQLARSFSVPQLLQAGKKAAHLCKVYRARIWRCVPTDQTMLVACRCEWRERQSIGAAPQRAA